MYGGKVIVKAEFQVPYCLLKYKFLLEEYRKKSPVASPSLYHVGLEITVEPPCATTSHKQPPIQNTKIFPVTQALQFEPLVNDHLLQATATTFWA